MGGPQVLLAGLLPHRFDAAAAEGEAGPAPAAVRVPERCLRMIIDLYLQARPPAAQRRARHAAGASPAPFSSLLGR